MKAMKENKSWFIILDFLKENSELKNFSESNRKHRWECASENVKMQKFIFNDFRLLNNSFRDKSWKFLLTSWILLEETRPTFKSSL